MLDKCRIVSLDGSSLSGGTGFISAEFLRQLDQRLQARHVRDTRHGFLNWVDFFAGTSAGGLNALYLAMHEQPHAALETILDFWKGVVHAAFAPSLGRMVGAAAGQNAMFSSARLREFFCQTFKHPTTGKLLKLGDLPRNVIVTSFQLDLKASEDKPLRSWRPKIFRNYPETEPDREELVVDVALRTCSPPILMPIYHSQSGEGPGYIDGGVVANNPAMIAVAEVIREMATGRFVWQQRQQAAYQSEQSEEAITPGRKSLDDILLLSVGNGRTPTYVTPQALHGMADWGYAPWFLNPLKPLVFLNLVLQSGIQTSHFQCEQLLGDHYRRLDPEFPHTMNVTKWQDIPAKLAEILALPQTDTQIECICAWFDTHREAGGVQDYWFDEPASCSDEPGKDP